MGDTLAGAIEPGNLVWSGYDGFLRFGVVIAKRIDESGWAYYKVKWHNDEKHENVLKYYRSLNPKGNYGLEEYRVGQLYRFSVEELLTTALTHLNYKG